MLGRLIELFIFMSGKYWSTHLYFFRAIGFMFFSAAHHKFFFNRYTNSINVNL